MEIYHEVAQVVPPTLCERCGNHCKNQELTLTLKRPHITRVFIFCSMVCLRKWVQPIR